MSDELTYIENESIRAFVQHAADAGYLSGRVLDFGAGRMPYRDIVLRAGGDHWVYDSHEFPASMVAEGFVGHDFKWEDKWGDEYWDAILCTQVVQYLPMYPYYDENSIQSVLSSFSVELEPGKGHLVMTYPTNWPEVQDVDLHRFTKAGMERLLTEAGFEIIEHVQRPTFEHHGYEWALGYGVIARA